MAKEELSRMYRWFGKITTSDELSDYCNRKDIKKVDIIYNTCVEGNIDCGYYQRFYLGLKLNNKKIKVAQAYGSSNGPRIERRLIEVAEALYSYGLKPYYNGKLLTEEKIAQMKKILGGNLEDKFSPLPCPI